MSEVIKGVPLDFSGTELISHLLKQAKHHEERAVFYHSKIEEFESMGYKDENISGGDVMKRLTDKVNQHTEQAQHFGVMADHIRPDATYRLDRQDLVFVGLLKRAY